MNLRKAVVGIDFDFKEHFPMWYYLFRVVLSSKYYGYKVWVYRTKHGYHVRIALGREDLIHFARLFFGDDPWRLYHDEDEKVGSRAYNTLFCWKDGSIEEEINPESLIINGVRVED